MKVRSGFVSNSSSSSFCIKLQDLTEDQINHIKEHIVFAELKAKEKDPDFKDFVLYADCKADEWDVFEHEKHLCGGTGMDNFDMEFLLNAIGVPEEAITWTDFYWNKSAFIERFGKS